MLFKADQKERHAERVPAPCQAHGTPRVLASKVRGGEGHLRTGSAYLGSVSQGLPIPVLLQLLKHLKIPRRAYDVSDSFCKCALNARHTTLCATGSLRATGWGSEGTNPRGVGRPLGRAEQGAGSTHRGPALEAGGTEREGTSPPAVARARVHPAVLKGTGCLVALRTGARVLTPLQPPGTARPPPCYESVVFYRGAAGAIPLSGTGLAMVTQACSQGRWVPGGLGGHSPAHVNSHGQRGRQHAAPSCFSLAEATGE